MRRASLRHRFAGRAQIATTRTLRILETTDSASRTCTCIIIDAGFVCVLESPYWARGAIRLQLIQHCASCTNFTLAAYIGEKTRRANGQDLENSVKLLPDVTTSYLKTTAAQTVRCEHPMYVPRADGRKVLYRSVGKWVRMAEA